MSCKRLVKLYLPTSLRLCLNVKALQPVVERLPARKSIRTPCRGEICLGVRLGFSGIDQLELVECILILEVQYDSETNAD